MLLKLAQGMQELARTKTDGKGRFTIDVPADGSPMHLLRVMHDKANYFKPVPPGTQSLEMDVYTASEHVNGVTLDADVMRLQTEPGGDGLRVVEHFFIKNDSSPATTLFSDHPFELYLPPGAQVEGSAAKAPGGMAVQQGLVPEAEANRFTVLFPLRPGETEFQVSYKLPYKASDGLSFQPRPVMPTDNLVVMLPKSMNFKAGTGTPYSSVTEEVSAQTYVARNVQPSQPLGFQISGAGELPRDPAPGAQSGGGQQPDQASSADPTAATTRDTRPGGGLGTPVDKDADRESWISKYRWWLVSGLTLLFALAAGIMLRSPAGAKSTPAGGGTIAPTGASGSALQALRDELFAVETDRIAGKLTETQYTELKASFDVVLRRVLTRGEQA